MSGDPAHPLHTALPGMTPPFSDRLVELTDEIEHALARARSVAACDDATAAGRLQLVAKLCAEARQTVMNGGGSMPLAFRFLDETYRTAHRLAVERFGPGQSVVSALGHVPVP